MNKSRAFTLIELLLVTGILSIIVSVIFFRVTEAKKKAEDAHMVAETAQVSRAIYQYKSDNGGRVPGGYDYADDENVTLLERNPGETQINPYYVDALQPLVDEGYIPEIPMSPSGYDYAYIIAPDGESGVFAADLNYQRSNSDSTNSCSVSSGGGGESETSYSSCWYAGNFIANYCPEYTHYDPETESCVPVTNSFLYSNCSCATSNNPQIPDSICAHYVLSQNGQSCQTFGVNNGMEDLFICAFDAEETSGELCDGSSNTDYCQCL